MLGGILAEAGNAEILGTGYSKVFNAKMAV
jgi:hypothetical protein